MFYGEKRRLVVRKRAQRWKRRRSAGCGASRIAASACERAAPCVAVAAVESQANGRLSADGGPAGGAVLCEARKRSFGGWTRVRDTHRRSHAF